MNQLIAQHLRTTLCIATIATIAFMLFLHADSSRSWANYADQELTLTYNAMLLLAGLRQESYDHTGYVTMYLLGQYMKIKSFMNDTVLITLEQINKPGYFNTFQMLVGYAREFAAISAFAITSLVFALARSIQVGRLASLFVAIAFFFSTGVLIHFEQLRTELLSIAILLISAYIFSKATEKKSEDYYKILIISLIVLNLAIINKMQIYIFALVYFYGMVLIKQRVTQPTATTLQAKAILPTCSRYDYVLCVCLVVLYFAAGKINQMTITSMFMMSIFFVGGGIVLAIGLSHSHTLKIALPNKSLFMKFVSAYAASLIISIALLMMLSKNPLIFIHVVNPSNLALYVSDHSYSLDWFLRLISSPIHYAASPNHTPPIYLIAIAVAAVAARKHLIKLDAWAAVYFLTSFYFVTLTSSFRYAAPHYEIFAETLLLLAFLYFLRLVPRNSTKVILSFLLLACNFSTTFVDISEKLQQSTGLEKEYCNSSFMKDQHHKINLTAFHSECSMAGLRKPSE